MCQLSESGFTRFKDLQDYNLSVRRKLKVCATNTELTLFCHKWLYLLTLTINSGFLNIYIGGFLLGCFFALMVKTDNYLWTIAERRFFRWADYPLLKGSFKRSCCVTKVEVLDTVNRKYYLSVD